VEPQRDAQRRAVRALANSKQGLRCTSLDVSLARQRAAMALRVPSLNGVPGVWLLCHALLCHALLCHAWPGSLTAYRQKLIADKVSWPGTRVSF
jgi:hypothetical protein